MIDDFAGGLLPGDFFDGLKGHRHGENLLNLGFTDVQRHWARLRWPVDSSREMGNRSASGT